MPEINSSGTLSRVLGYVNYRCIYCNKITLHRRIFDSDASLWYSDPKKIKCLNCKKVFNVNVDTDVRGFGLTSLESTWNLKDSQVIFLSSIDEVSELEKNLNTKLEKINQLESELTTERESTQQALQTSQEWHERQKAEIIAQWKTKLQTFIQQRKTQLQQEIQLIKEVLHE